MFSLLWSFNLFKDFCERSYSLDHLQKSFRNSCVSCLQFNGIFLIFSIFPHYYIFCMSKDLLYFPLDLLATFMDIYCPAEASEYSEIIWLGLGILFIPPSLTVYSLKQNGRDELLFLWYAGIFGEVLTAQTSPILHQHNSFLLCNCRTLHLGLFNEIYFWW